MSQSELLELLDFSLKKSCESLALAHRDAHGRATHLRDAAYHMRQAARGPSPMRLRHGVKETANRILNHIDAEFSCNAHRKLIWSFTEELVTTTRLLDLADECDREAAS